jgi:Flp pilus assembly protein TadG
MTSIALYRNSMPLKSELERPVRAVPSFSHRKRTIRSTTRLVSANQGSAVLEVALLLPVVLLLLTGMCAFALAFLNQLTLTSAVGAGAQYLQLIRTSSTNPCQDTFATIQNAAPTLAAGNINMTFSFAGTTVTGNSCPGDQSYLIQGQPVTVTATYPCSLAIYGSISTNCQLAATVSEYEY